MDFTDTPEWADLQNRLKIELTRREDAKRAASIICGDSQPPLQDRAKELECETRMRKFLTGLTLDRLQELVDNLRNFSTGKIKFGAYAGIRMAILERAKEEKCLEELQDMITMLVGVL